MVSPKKGILFVFEGVSVTIITDKFIDNYPISYQGILMDEDEEYIYLASNDSYIISTIVNKASILSIVDDEEMKRQAEVIEATQQNLTKKLVQ